MKSTVTAVARDAVKRTAAKRGLSTMPPQQLYNRMPAQIPKFPPMPKQAPAGAPDKALWKSMPPQEPKFKAMPTQEPINPDSITQKSGGGSGPMIVVALGVVGLGGAVGTGVIPMPM